MSKNMGEEDMDVNKGMGRVGKGEDMAVDKEGKGEDKEMDKGEDMVVGMGLAVAVGLVGMGLGKEAVGVDMVYKNIHSVYLHNIRYT